ncbi:MAG: hypothetical protein L6R38_003544 [Xanthoria sp. 2 TBL-2021]|nr:MAG: hypothetical protein L6R38_003544 [Xanthoria sp. 2 TBL-2021]
MDQDKQKAGTNTQVLAVDVDKIGDFIFHEPDKSFLGDWDINLSKNNHDANNLLQAVKQLQTSSLPVAFPTETVYGLGADATRSDAVAGIYAAKQRPADNPLIVHISSLGQLRRLLGSTAGSRDDSPDAGTHGEIPAIYDSLISRFWPGPLSILLPLPNPSPLAPAVTGSLSTFGVRMPSSRLALALIHLAGLPLAAPSANASTRPSPTTAAHVLHDLSGRIDLIIDGGPCMVGIESTVVDGLTSPPAILRPGGVSIEMIRQCRGWEHVAIGYSNNVEIIAPRAPGMKYKHYSPKARVILVHGRLTFGLVTNYLRARGKVGLVSTMTWRAEDLEMPQNTIIQDPNASRNSGTKGFHRRFALKTLAADMPNDGSGDGPSMNGEINQYAESIQFSSVNLGNEAAGIAQGLFSALRELDLDGVDVIFVEAIKETEGDAAAAVMNRLRKAAESEIKT